ncbi:diguanylate cyclase domain-containing protein [Sulfurimonas sp.]|uniref:diguanylate cyclase domain-containing protein n=1 Tax=Sulfurimonas sp. TaxID=2022749 RepID=UPI003D120796
MHFNIKIFKSKIFLIFLVPTISIVYFTFYFVKLTNANIEAISTQKYNIELVEKIVDVIHALQIERINTLKYLATPRDKILKKRLLTSSEQTDNYITAMELFEHNKDLELRNVSTLRENVLKHHLSFEKATTSYTRFNTNLINKIKYLLPKLDQARYDALFLINLELFKENAELERSCIYYELLTNMSSGMCKEKLGYYQNEQKKKQEDLLVYSSDLSLNAYSKSFDIEEEQEVEKLRKLYKKGQLTKKDAQQWLDATTNRIDIYQTSAHKVLDNFIKLLNTNYTNTDNSLYLATIFWVTTIIASIYFIYLIEILFKDYEKHAEDLKLSSHTLNSHEGVFITDKDTNIIKVNNGFERITGYSSKEVIGQKVNILKSSTHSEAFYQTLWNSLNSTGTWSGEIFNKRKDGEIYAQRLSISSIKDKKGEIKNYVGHIFDISELKKAQEEALYQATHDFLTDLTNRNFLLTRMKEELGRSRRHDLKNAFMFIDLDHFKSINDTYGHHIGDKLLQHVADIIKNSVRECDIVARISGDEFAVVLLDIDLNSQKSDETISLIADKILTRLNNEIIIENNKLKIGSSIGIRIFPLNDVDNEDQIIKDADHAMYLAKNNGRNRFVIFTQS